MSDLSEKEHAALIEAALAEAGYPPGQTPSPERPRLVYDPGRDVAALTYRYDIGAVDVGELPLADVWVSFDAAARGRIEAFSIGSPLFARSPSEQRQLGELVGPTTWGHIIRAASRDEATEGEMIALPADELQELEADVWPGLHTLVRADDATLPPEPRELRERRGALTRAVLDGSRRILLGTLARLVPSHLASAPRVAGARGGLDLDPGTKAYDAPVELPEPLAAAAGVVALLVALLEEGPEGTTLRLRAHGDPRAGAGPHIGLEVLRAGRADEPAPFLPAPDGGLEARLVLGARPDVPLVLVVRPRAGGEALELS